jgi:Activator of Hsp90 ATPase homolog 1-like protein
VSRVLNGVGGVGIKITVETTVFARVNEVWRAYTTPEDIKQWNAASDDWHTTTITVDLRVGGTFSSRMEAKEGSFGFDFVGTTYTQPGRAGTKGSLSSRPGCLLLLRGIRLTPR